jgi:hypothetical protein
MANVKAVASGNWSDTATWDGGVLPTVNDDVFSNTFTVTIDGTFEVLSITNAAATGITAGGSFTFANGGDLTCTAGDGVKPAGATVLNFNLASGNSATLRGNVIRPVTNGITSMTCSNTGTFNIVGNLTMSSTGQTQSIFGITANSTINHIGDIINNGTNVGSLCVNIAGANLIVTYNHTGNCQGGNTASSTTGLAINNIGSQQVLTYNGTGNHTAGTSPSIYTTTLSTFNITGNVTGTESRMAINNATNAATINVNGIITAGANQPAIVGLITTLVKVQGTIINQGTYNAIYAGRITLEGNIAYWQYRNALNNTSTNLYTVGALNYPDELDVRDGIDYGASLELTGTLAVPTADNVRKGVPIDDTVGTADLTAEDFLTAIEESTLDIAERLRNVATVQTTGDQVVGLS